ncbi:MAG TPA: tRNA 2-thiouridine(34) synthase MnmA, partial [Candidatus Paceibacterota bacterium]|nr:tRNA 2-thiouridine(34) synthase MnmA [Candidatus Paceibacterota bacterium]
SQAKQTVFVAMSGGVDSAVAALLLVHEGYRVVGIFMRPWQPRGMACLWRRDREDAMRVAAHLGIPLRTWDFSTEYGRRVASPMVAGYRAGMTPNPDVECNRHIKFGLFAARAFREGADRIATGHYARVDHGIITHAADTNKDQTYFLWAVPQRIMARTMFPLGGLTKPRVRAIARRAGLPVADKKDSQGVCFIGDLDVSAFLKRRIAARPGPIVHRDGRTLGTHDGAAFCTIGQRHGLDIGDGGGPYYVIGRDVRRNIITVGDERDLYGRRARFRSANWFVGRPAGNARFDVQIRYRTPAVPATVRGNIIEFTRPVRALTPGQSVVFYRGRRLAGGAILR